jgi:DNA invertase Pin-like site-specific DNA recombinase
MLAAIYARKSTEQNGIADEARSVARQVEHARRYAARKGWAVADEHVYIDDGISGAEFQRRPGFLRLMNTLKPRAPFQVLVMSEESRLGREAIETAYALKQLVQADVQVWFYLDDRQRTLDSPMEKAMLSLQTMADEMERDKARQRTYDAMQRKARAGQVTGGRLFGYRNVDVLTDRVDANGRALRSHVERQVDEREAAVVRRIFQLCADGYGMRTIAVTLNDDGAPSPRAQQGRPSGWAPSSVREVLYRDVYRGVIVWNKTQKRDRWGKVKQRPRPESEWLRLDAPQLRVVDDALWQATHARLSATRAAYVRSTAGQLWGKPPTGAAAKYLLTGLARCGACGGGILVRSRSHGRKRPYRYACSCYHLKGTRVCRNHLEALMEAADQLVFDAITEDVLNPEVIEHAVSHAVARVLEETSGGHSRRDDIEAALRRVNEERDRLVGAIAAGGNLDALVGALQERERQRADLQRELTELTTLTRTNIDRRGVERAVRERLAEWQAVLGRQTVQARQIVTKLLDGKVTLTPTTDADGAPAYEVRATFTLGRFFQGILGPRAMASPTATEPFLTEGVVLRPAA